ASSSISVCLSDEFTCSVCLDTLTDPVSLHCGHSFCLKCLSNYWDQNQELCSCPHCRHTFTTRPELNRNTLLNEVIKKLKEDNSQSSTSSELCPPWRHAFKNHRLTDPDPDLLNKLCVNHKRILNVFCKEDQMYISKSTSGLAALRMVKCRLNTTNAPGVLQHREPMKILPSCRGAWFSEFYRKI
uniref:RING-type domain-containing protein n=1 Tax=Erpetoichthys calabaricus TaxID=27687 RepID=A0A8C4TEZ7_ERPCA